MRVLALDIGYRLGYAVGERPNRLLEHGTKYFLNADREKQLQEFLVDIITKYDINLVVFEQFRAYRNISYAHTTPEIAGMVKAVCNMLNVEYDEINHNKWKKHFRNLYFITHELLPENWKNALQGGSEHSRDAVQILFSYVISPVLLKVHKNERF